MKRIGISSLILLIALVIGISSYKYFNTPNISLKETNQVTITTLPSPPKQKVVTHNDDIIRFVEFFNSIKLSPTVKQNSRGWETQVKIDGSERHTLLLIEGYISFDGSWYAVDDLVIEEMRNLYQTFDYPEEAY